MGILGSILKMGLTAGASAIPGVGPFLGPAVGAGLAGGQGGILSRGVNAGIGAGTNFGLKKLGTELFDSPEPATTDTGNFIDQLTLASPEQLSNPNLFGADDPLTQLALTDLQKRMALKNSFFTGGI